MLIGKNARIALYPNRSPRHLDNMVSSVGYKRYARIAAPVSENPIMAHNSRFSDRSLRGPFSLHRLPSPPPYRPSSGYDNPG